MRIVHSKDRQQQIETDGPAAAHEGLGRDLGPPSSGGASQQPYADDLLRLQEQFGNHAVQQLVNPGQTLVVQPKLYVGEIDTPSELEADRLASEIASGRTPVSRVSRVAGGQWPVAPELEQSIGRARSGGRPLPDALRASAEQGLGMDLGAVRVHTDRRADELSSVLEAKAFTTGHDVFFRQGTYEPATPAGRSLIAHELTHVAQQAGPPGPESDGSEAAGLDQHDRGGPDLVQRTIKDTRGVVQGQDAVIRWLIRHGGAHGVTRQLAAQLYREHMGPDVTIHLGALLAEARQRARAAAGAGPGPLGPPPVVGGGPPVIPPMPAPGPPPGPVPAPVPVPAPHGPPAWLLALNQINVPLYQPPGLSGLQPVVGQSTVDPSGVLRDRRRSNRSDAKEPVVGIDETAPPRIVFPRREEIVRALTGFTPFTGNDNSENVTNVGHVTIGTASWVVKFESAGGGQREVLPPVIARQFGLGQHYVPAILMDGPDGTEREPIPDGVTRTAKMVVMPLVDVSSGRAVQDHEIDEHFGKGDLLALWLFEWMIGSTDRHGKNILRDRDGTLLLFDHGASLGVGGRGQEIPTHPGKRLGPRNLLFQVWAGGLLDVEPFKLQPDWSKLRKEYKKPLGDKFVPRDAVDRALLMGAAAYSELQNDDAPQAYLEYVQTGIDHLRDRAEVAEKASQSVTVRDILTSGDVRRPKPPDSTKRKRSKRKKRANVKVSKSKSPGPQEPIESARIARMDQANEVFNRLIANFMRRTKKYPFVSKLDADSSRQRIIEMVLTSEKMPDDEQMGAELGLGLKGKLGLQALGSADLGTLSGQRNFAEETEIIETAKRAHRRDLEKVDARLRQALLDEASLYGTDAVEPGLDLSDAKDVAYYLDARLRQMGIETPVGGNLDENEGDVEPITRNISQIKRTESLLLEEKMPEVQLTRQSMRQLMQYLGGATEVALLDSEQLKERAISWFNEQEKEHVTQRQVDLRERQQRSLALENLRWATATERLTPQMVVKEAERREIFSSKLALLADAFVVWEEVDRRQQLLNELRSSELDPTLILAAAFGPNNSQFTGSLWTNPVVFTKSGVNRGPANKSREMYKFLFDGGPEPRRLNCFEAVLLAGFRTNRLTRAQIIDNLKIDPETTARNISARVWRWARAQSPVCGRTAPTKTDLWRSLKSDPPNIPAGWIIDWGDGRQGGSHTALSLGNGLVQENDGPTGGQRAGVRIQTFVDITRNVNVKSDVKVYWAPYEVVEVLLQ